MIMFVKILFFIFFTLHSLTSFAQPISNACNTVLSYDITPQKTKISHQKSISELSSIPIHLKRQNSMDFAFIAPTFLDQPKHALGLYQAKGNLNMDIKTKIIPQGELFALCIESIHFKYVYDQDIFIASSIQPTTCLYQEVLRHELMHQNIQYKTTVAAFEDFNKNNNLPMHYFASDLNSAQQKAALYQKIIISVMQNNLNQQVQLAQSAIDHDHEYQHVISSCLHAQKS